jgi:hypothetical protein
MISKKFINGSLIPAIASIVFAVFALTFGMGDWRSAAATASAPPATTQQ